MLTLKKKEYPPGIVDYKALCEEWIASSLWFQMYFF